MKAIGWWFALAGVAAMEFLIFWIYGTQCWRWSPCDFNLDFLIPIFLAGLAALPVLFIIAIVVSVMQARRG